MNQIKAILLFLIVLSCSPEPVEDFVIPIKSISPNDIEFSDLQPLKKAIGNARIVMLGEQNHGDGSSIAARVRLVKFLHEEMGFNTLAMESQMFSGKMLQDHKLALDTGNYWNDIRFGIMKVWAHSEQCYPLWQYLFEKPNLKIVGFDSQIEDGHTRHNFKPRLNDFFLKLKLDTADYPSLFDVLAKLVDPRYLFARWKPEKKMKDRFNQELNEVIEKLRIESQTSTNEELKFYLRWFINVRDQTNRSRWSEQQHARDSIMADNILWLANDYFPNDRIICWGALRHFIKNPWQINTQMDFKYEYGYTTAGNLVVEQMEQEIYILGTTEYEGITSRGPWPDGFGYEEDTLTVSSDISLERHIEQLGLEYAFVDFKNHKGPYWLMRDSVVSRPIGAVEMKAIWPDILDGLLFIKTMEPNRRKAFWK